MGKKETLLDTEKDLFRASVRGVKPLKNSKIAPEPTKKPFKKRLPPVETEENSLNLYESDYATEVSGETLLEFHRSGLQHKVLRNFRQGKYNTDVTLDLHGMTVDEAREAMNTFLLGCFDKGIQSIKIIHGKGRGLSKPILKNKVNQWLRQVDFVLAFISARPREGSSGALYVLLKRK